MAQKANTPFYHNILVALDGSALSTQGLHRALELASIAPGAIVTGIHVFPASAGSGAGEQPPSTTPFLELAAQSCKKANIPFKKRIASGREYRALDAEIRNGTFDLVVMGASGVGAISEDEIGSVCEMLVKRCTIDILVISNSSSRVKGPLLVAVDGSPNSFGGVLTALELGKQWSLPITMVSAFDSDYHKAVFSYMEELPAEEGAELFASDEMDKLQKAVSGSGVSKLYDIVLDIGKDVVEPWEITVDYLPLVGKPAVVIREIAHGIKPSLLVMGKTGIHADGGLTIGSVTENLLHSSGCDLLITSRTHVPTIKCKSKNSSISLIADRQLQSSPDSTHNDSEAAETTEINSRLDTSGGKTALASDSVREFTQEDTFEDGKRGKIPQPEDGSGHRGKIPEPEDESGHRGKIPQPENESGRWGKIPEPEDESGRRGKIPQPEDESGGRRGKIPEPEAESGGRRGKIPEPETESGGRRGKIPQPTMSQEAEKALAAAGLQDETEVKLRRFLLESTGRMGLKSFNSDSGRNMLSTFSAGQDSNFESLPWDGKHVVLNFIEGFVYDEANKDEFFLDDRIVYDQPEDIISILEQHRSKPVQVTIPGNAVIFTTNFARLPVEHNKTTDLTEQAPAVPENLYIYPLLPASGNFLIRNKGKATIYLEHDQKLLLCEVPFQGLVHTGKQRVLKLGFPREIKQQPNKRKSQRVKVSHSQDISCEVVVDASKTAYPATIFDMSTEGVSFYTAQTVPHLDSGVKLKLHLEIADKLEVNVTGMVVGKFTKEDQSCILTKLQVEKPVAKKIVQELISFFQYEQKIKRKELFH
jgi:nucleotide-binding universal stress UspA family protein